MYGDVHSHQDPRNRKSAFRERCSAHAEHQCWGVPLRFGRARARVWPPTPPDERDAARNGAQSPGYALHWQPGRCTKDCWSNDQQNRGVLFCIDKHLRQKFDLIMLMVPANRWACGFKSVFRECLCQPRGGSGWARLCGTHQV